jgi:hypothetical protein
MNWTMTVFLSHLVGGWLDRTRRRLDYKAHLNFRDPRRQRLSAVAESGLSRLVRTANRSVRSPQGG